MRKCIECKYSYNELTTSDHVFYSNLDFGVYNGECINNAEYTPNCAEYDSTTSTP